MTALYPSPFHAEAAGFLAWEAIEGDHRKRLAETMARLGEDTVRRATRVLTAPLPFYPSAELVALSISGVSRDRFSILVYGAAEELVRLDGTNEPIYGLNERVGLSADPARLALYVRFFFHFVRGQLGSFRIVEAAGELPWTPDADAAQRQRVAALLMPLTYLGLDPDGLHHFTATILFKNGLFKSDILCASRETDHRDAALGIVEHFTLGKMRLTDEALLAEELAVAIETPGSDSDD